MGKVATGSEPRALVPARGYYAVVCGVFDIGTQDSGNFGPSQQFVVEFELHRRKKGGGGTEPARDEKGNTLTICMFVNFYLGQPAKPAKLLKLAEACERRKFTEAECKAGYDIETAIGKTLKVQVIHKESSGVMKAQVDSIAPLDDDDDEPEATLDSAYFEIKPDSREIPEKLPKFVRDFIAKSVEFAGKKAPAMAGASVGAAAGGVDDEDIPF